LLGITPRRITKTPTGVKGNLLEACSVAIKSMQNSGR